MVNKYYQNNEEKLRKEARENIKIFLKKKKKKSVCIIVKTIRIFMKKKKIRKLSIWEIIIKHIKNIFSVDLLIFEVLGQNNNSKNFFIAKSLQNHKKTFRIFSIFHGLVLKILKKSLRNFYMGLEFFTIKSFLNFWFVLGSPISRFVFEVPF